MDVSCGYTNSNGEEKMMEIFGMVLLSVVSFIAGAIFKDPFLNLLRKP